MPDNSPIPPLRRSEVRTVSLKQDQWEWLEAQANSRPGDDRSKILQRLISREMAANELETA